MTEATVSVPFSLFPPQCADLGDVNRAGSLVTEILYDNALFLFRPFFLFFFLDEHSEIVAADARGEAPFLFLFFPRWMRDLW